MSGPVRGIAAEFEATVVSDGSDNVIDFGHDALGDGGGWLDVRSFVRLSAYVDVGLSGCSFTVEGKTSKNAIVEDVYAQAASASDARILDKTSIENFCYVRFKEQGTNTETNSVYVCAK